MNSIVPCPPGISSHHMPSYLQNHHLNTKYGYNIRHALSQVTRRQHASALAATLAILPFANIMIFAAYKLPFPPPVNPRMEQPLVFVAGGVH